MWSMKIRSQQKKLDENRTTNSWEKQFFVIPRKFFTVSLEIFSCFWGLWHVCELPEKELQWYHYYYSPPIKWNSAAWHTPQSKFKTKKSVHKRARPIARPASKRESPKKKVLRIFRIATFLREMQCYRRFLHISIVLLKTFFNFNNKVSQNVHWIGKL